MERKVREALLGDVAAIAAIHVNAWKSAFKGLMPKGYIDKYTVQLRQREWLQAISTGVEHVLVALDNNQIVGFLSYSEAKSSAAILELHKLYLCPSVYRKGIGQLLMAQLALKAKAKDIEEMNLYVLDTNKVAITFYRKLGFEFSANSLTDTFEGETITDLQMVKRL
ncbi:N-acetyltransferase family protein [Agarivorans sp. DSG3-1]|uniref:GNAT family N-acetyltransferase n=1 Tax=Agarivorans sp. DSG3-1 TaxID=3342249 RepID=UPI00398E649A